MKKLSLAVVCLLSLSAWASVPFYTIQTTQDLSDSELADQCGKDRNEAAAKLEQIAKRLTSSNPDALSVSAFYGKTPLNGTPSNPNLPADPSIVYEYYCLLAFDSTDPGLFYETSSPAHLEHLKKGNWDSACTPAYDSASANPNSPMTLYWKSWTLFQGRICDVTTIEVKKKGN